jgi:3-dehydroquinate dehydratase/shikimate dehydrogenase
VTGHTTEELRQARDAVRDADLVELRLDGVRDIDVAGALQGRRLPALVTCRPQWEGGAFDGSEEERQQILARAVAVGAEYVDVEWKAGFTNLIASANRTCVVLSNHDFEGVPADLADRCRAMRATGAAVVKIAYAARRLSDCLHVFDITREGRAVGIAMGPAGVATRILAARFGSVWTYAGGYRGTGQLAPSVLAGTFRFRSICATTTVYGVVGHPVMHSVSPSMHNAAFDALGTDAVYLPLEAVDFQDFLTFADRLRVMGVSVTIPFKLDALACAHQADDTTRAVGAANTLRRQDRAWEATNTDIAGFLEPLLDWSVAEGRALRGVRASVLGAGGAARAVVRGLVLQGVHVTVHARRQEQAHAAVTGTGATVGLWPPARGSWDLLVNCTPLGMAGHSTASPVSLDGGGGTLVYDLVYVPEETPLLREARAAGCMTLGGLPMLVAQAERQCEWWTGRRPPGGVMIAAAREALAQRGQHT